MTEKAPWSSSQLRKYNINSDPIPRLKPDDSKINEFIKENVSSQLMY